MLSPGNVNYLTENEKQAFNSKKSPSAIHLTRNDIHLYYGMFYKRLFKSIVGIRILIIKEQLTSKTSCKVIV